MLLEQGNRRKRLIIFAVLGDASVFGELLKELHRTVAFEEEAWVCSVVQHLLRVVAPKVARFRHYEDCLGFGLTDWTGRIFADQPHLVGALVADRAVTALSQSHVGFDRAAEHTGAVVLHQYLSMQLNNSQKTKHLILRGPAPSPCVRFASAYP